MHVTVLRFCVSEQASMTAETGRYSSVQVMANKYSPLKTSMFDKNKPKKDKIYDSGKEKQFQEKQNRTFENKKLQI